MSDHMVRVIKALEDNRGVALPTINQLMAEAWDEGATAQAQCYGMDKDTGPNPYRRQP